MGTQESSGVQRSGGCPGPYSLPCLDYLQSWFPKVAAFFFLAVPSLVCLQSCLPLPLQWGVTSWVGDVTGGCWAMYLGLCALWEGVLRNCGGGPVPPPPLPSTIHSQALPGALALCLPPRELCQPLAFWGEINQD